MLLYTSLLTIILAVILAVYNFKFNKTSIYLSVYLISQAVYGLVHYAVVYSNSATWIALLYVNLAPITFLAGPFLYFYIRDTISDKRTFLAREFLHFIPFIINLIGILPHLFSPFEHKLEIARQILSDLTLMKTLKVNWILPTGFFTSARIISLFCYTLYSSYFISTHLRRLKTNQSPLIQEKLVIRWIYSLIIISYTISICSAITVYKFLQADSSTIKEVITNMPYVNIGGIAYFLIPVMLMVFPQVIYGIPLLSISVSNSDSIKKDIRDKGTFNQEKKNQIEELEPFKELAKNIIQYIENEKPYLNPEFSIDTIVNQLDIPKHHVYYCFNTVIQIKFTTMRTRMRVDYAKELLQSSEMNYLSMEGIGSKSGFASRSSFFAAFKDITGITPKEFLENNQAKNQ